LVRIQDTSSKTTTPDKDRAGVRATLKAQELSKASSSSWIMDLLNRMLKKFRNFVKLEERVEEMPGKPTKQEEAELWLRLIQCHLSLSLKSDQ